jgi:hypothetical protein
MAFEQTPTYEVSTNLSRHFICRSGSFGCIGLILEEVPGQQLVDSVDRMFGDADQDLAKIGFWIKTVQFARPCDLASKQTTRPVRCFHRRIVGMNLLCG